MVESQVTIYYDVASKTSWNHSLQHYGGEVGLQEDTADSSR